MAGLAGQHVLVLGGGSGIGAATAGAALAAGATVTIAGRSAARLAQARARLGAGTAALAADATDGESLAALATACRPLDHLVVSIATGGGAGPFRTLDLEVLRAAIEGKTLAALRALQLLLPRLRADGSALFVTAASAQAAAPGTVGLAANNGALAAAVRPLAAELAPLRINAVAPGIVATEIFAGWPAETRAAFAARAGRSAVGRAGRPEEIGALIVAVLANDFLTGSVILADGGLSLSS